MLFTKRFAVTMAVCMLATAARAEAILPPTSTRAARATALMERLQTAGATFSKCAVASKDELKEGECSVVSTAPIEPGDVLIRVPFACTVNARVGRRCEAGADAYAHRLALGTTDEDLMAIALLAIDAGSGADAIPEDALPVGMREYHASLPTAQELSHVPVFWSPDDAALLRGSGIGANLDHVVAREAAFHARLSALSPSFARIATEAQWTWAKASVYARTFGERQR